MKKLCILIWIVCHTAWATPGLRHTEGIQGLALTGGKTSMGYCVDGAYSAYINSHWYWKLALGGAWTHPTPVSYQAFHCMPAIAATLLESNKAFYLNFLGGLAPTYERHQQRGDTHQGWKWSSRLQCSWKARLVTPS